MDFRILGPIEALDDDRSIALGSARQRAVLAVLLARLNQLVPKSRLIDDVWGEDPPQSAANLVHGYVSGLRKALGRDVIVTRGTAYQLVADEDALDANRFERLTKDAAELLAAGRVEDAATTLRRALALWRGPAFADIADWDFARIEGARLEELRFAVIDRLVDVELALGRHDALVGELKMLVSRHPLRERLHWSLMLALYRSGRQADALAAYQDARRTLVENLGIEPSAALRELEQAILMQDPSLAPAEPAPALAVAPPEADTTDTPPPPSDAAPAERRKQVTALCCNLATSTEGGEAIDPELLRDVSKRHFELAAAVLERHGGRLDSCIGNAFLAVFGVPEAHEDDALRAVRAASELRAGVAALSEHFEIELGVTLAARIGIGSGEVVATEDSATGEPISRTAALERAAGEHEVMLDAATLSLVANAVRVEPVALPAPRGKGGEGQAFRMLELLEGMPAYARRFDAPFVGREEELDQLRRAYRRCVREEACLLFTLLGPAGIGKSRLAREACLELGDSARVLTGGCLPYGEAITFWPLREMLVAAAGEQLEETLPALLASHPDATWIASSVAGLLGYGPGGGSLEDGQLAVRWLFEHLASERPLVLVFEDVHWADPALLDLVEYVADLARDAPIFLLCIAREELLQARPSWSGGKTNATMTSLDRLPADRAGELARSLATGEAVSAGARDRALTLAEGNPLFLEQLLAHARTETPGVAEFALPPTIDALLAARLDRLPLAERTLIDRAAVLGSEFEVAALVELTPAPLQATLTKDLTALVRKELLRPLAARPRREEAYRFRHILIRDATYQSISKRQRAALHEQCADRLELRHPDHQFFDELSGYHLEQAYRNRIDLHELGAETRELGRRASQRLEAAGGKALARSDLGGAVGLLERAASLAQADAQRARLLADLGAVLVEAGRLGDAEAAVLDARAAAANAGDQQGEARALVEYHLLELAHATSGATTAAAELAERLIPFFEGAHDHRGACRTRKLQAVADWTRGRAAAASAAWEAAALDARSAGEEYERAAILTWVASSLWLGPVPVDAGIARCEEIRREVGGHPASEAEVLRPLAGLYGFAGRFDDARSLFGTSTAVFQELGLGRGLNSVLSHPEVIVDVLQGNHALAEQRLRAGYDAFEEMGENAMRSTTAALLARAILAQDRDEEAERLTEISEELAQADDLLTQIVWRGVRAQCLARRGRFDDARELARDGVALAAQTDLLNFHADAVVDLADVLEAEGRTAEAAATVADAARLYEQKGNVVSAAQTRARLDTLAAV